MRHALAVALSIAALGLFARHASASDGRLEINQACVANGCFPGDLPGLPVETQSDQSYVMTSNLAVGSGAVGVTLGSGSTLDLNGFTIAGNVTCPSTPASCSQQGTNGGGVIAGERSVVKHGTIRGISSFGIRGGNFVRVEDMSIEQNAAGGIAASDGGFGWVIQDSRILQNGSYGISLNVNGGATGSRVLRNTIYGNQLVGLAGGVSLAIDNAIEANGSYGAQFNYSPTVTGYVGNHLSANNGGNANPQLTGGLSLGTNICVNATCP
jgi:hypothetical protein